jgi:small subunit ribosomal protein S16
MIKIRLLRTGARKKPKYRIVVASEQEKRDGRFIEIIGTYNPMTDPAKIDIKTDRYQHWVTKGAQPTKAASSLLKRYERISRVPG